MQMCMICVYIFLPNRYNLLNLTISLSCKAEFPRDPGLFSGTEILIKLENLRGCVCLCGEGGKRI